jgi:cytochrome oxidase assembly protein ShyY1
MLTLLRTPRWQGFTAVVVIAIVAFGLLSRWQWDRAEQKQAEARAQALSDTEAISPVPTDSLVEFTPVVMEGQYLPDSLRFVRQRPLEGRNGFWVMQQLSTDTGTVWLLRGWTPSGIRAGDSPQLPVEELRGEAVVTGVARPLPDGRALEGDDRGGLPPDQVTDITRGQLPGATAEDWFVQVRSAEPVDGLLVVPLPQNDDLQNISYAIQWLLFAGVAIGGWFFFLRREARDSGV